jgi:hypothetical protein
MSLGAQFLEVAEPGPTLLSGDSCVQLKAHTCSPPQEGVVEFTDTDGDTVVLKRTAANALHEGGIDYYVNDVLKVRRCRCGIRDHTIFLDGISAGNWSSARYTTVPHGQEHILKQALDLFAEKGVRVGDRVVVTSSEAELRASFDRIDDQRDGSTSLARRSFYTWDNAMTSILGKTMKVLEVRDAGNLVGLEEAKKNSGQAIWYYPRSAVRSEAAKDKGWTELTPEEQAAAEICGYTQAHWTNDEVANPLEDLSWVDVPEHQRKALLRLGWTEELWDKEDSEDEAEEEVEVNA